MEKSGFDDTDYSVVVKIRRSRPIAWRWEIYPSSFGPWRPLTKQGRQRSSSYWPSSTPNRVGEKPDSNFTSRILEGLTLWRPWWSRGVSAIFLDSVAIKAQHNRDSRRQRNAFGLSIQPFNRDPFECPVPSLRSMSGERKFHAHPPSAAALVAVQPMRWRATAQAD